MIKKLIFAAWIGLIGVSLSCEGPQGEVGPAGPAGPAGPNGAKGDTGVAGEDALGARVVTTASVPSTLGGYTFGISNLTPADTTLLSTAATFVYIKTGNWWNALPGNVVFSQGKSTMFSYRTWLRRGETFFVEIKPVSWSEDQATAPERTFESIRVVIVPTSSFRRTSAEIDWKDYNAVAKALNIKESDVEVIK